MLDGFLPETQLAVSKSLRGLRKAESRGGAGGKSVLSSLLEPLDEASSLLVTGCFEISANIKKV